MDIEKLNKLVDEQHERNQMRFGTQPTATLILETEDQVGKLRDALLHRTDGQVARRIVNICSLMWEMATQISWPDEAIRKQG